LTRRLQRGVGMIETMVGVLIGLIVVVVIYNLLAVTEGYRRITEGASDAQVTGLVSQLLVGREVANGGNGISISAADPTTSTGLINCDPAKAYVGNVWPFANLWRPIPVLIRNGGGNDTTLDSYVSTSDDFITLYGGSPHVAWGVPFAADAAPGDPFVVQSPTGFSSPKPGVSNYRVVAVNPVTGDCEASVVTDATDPDANGFVSLTHGAVTQNYQATVDPVSRLVNLGPQNQARRTLYEVYNTKLDKTCDSGAADSPCQLFSTDLLGGGVRNPVAQNVVLMKVQYGIDLSNPIDGRVDCWVPAIANVGALDPVPCIVPGGLKTDYTPASVRNFTLTDLQRIVAVRVGIVVRSDEPELKLAATELKFSNRPDVYLFNCAADDNTCQGRIKLSNTIIQDGWRYRTYESILPLRNAIFNALP
jgi:type IV pilus assembly protein PilW